MLAYYYQLAITWGLLIKKCILYTNYKDFQISSNMNDTPNTEYINFVNVKNTYKYF